MRCSMVVICVGALALGCSSDSSGSEAEGGRAGASNPFGNAGGAGSGPGDTGDGPATDFGQQPAQPGDPGTAPGNPNASNMARECASAQVTAAKSKPIITLIVDGSGSMCTDFGGQSRWQALRGALLDPAGGLIYQLEAGVEFGMLLYDGGIDAALALLGGSGGGMPSPCAGNYLMQRMGDSCMNQRVDVPTALNNAAAIDAAYPMTELGGSTPTDLAVREVLEPLVNNLPVVGPDDPAPDPRFVILATDGEPNSICFGGLGGDGAAQRQDVVSMVQWAADAGVKTYVISLAQDANLMQHLNDVATAGGTGMPPFTPTNRDDLVAALSQIIGGAIGCRVMLNGEVMPGQECSGFVEVNGFPLECNSPNGWTLIDPRTLELTGTACDDFINSPSTILRAGFPCGVFTPD